jgi:prepilin-type processing-associated H-X9-DG protein
VNLYLTDFQAYPQVSYFTGGPKPHYFNWDEVLEPYTATRWGHGILNCPEYKLKTSAADRTQAAVLDLFGSYGYNDNGTGHLGLGRGLPPNVVWSAPEQPTPVKESEVAVPSQTIAFGDANIFWFIDGKFYGMPYFNFGGGVLTTGRPSYLTVLNHFKRRHNDRLNVAFADAHVETFKRSNLFEDSENARRRWNTDNLGHSWSNDLWSGKILNIP